MNEIFINTSKWIKFIPFKKDKMNDYFKASYQQA